MLDAMYNGNGNMIFAEDIPDREIVYFDGDPYIKVNWSYNMNKAVKECDTCRYARSLAVKTKSDLLPTSLACCVVGEYKLKDKATKLHTESQIILLDSHEVCAQYEERQSYYDS